MDSTALVVVEVSTAELPTGGMVSSATPAWSPLDDMGMRDVFVPELDRGPMAGVVDAIAAVKQGRHVPMEALYTARLLERMPLHTPYPDVAVRVRRVIEWLGRAFPETAPDLVVDNTGVGIPVVDILRRELAEIPHRLIPVTIVAGDDYHAVVTPDGQDRPGRSVRTVKTVPRSARGLRVGKGFIVSRLQALLQTQRFRGPRKDVEALQEELRQFQIRAKVSHDEYGARVGAHDDLVIAAALAVLERPRRDATQIAELNSGLPFRDIVGMGGAGNAWDLP